MQLLHVINNLTTGGAQKLVSDLAIIQSRDSDIAVSIYIWERDNSVYEDRLRKAGVTIIHAPQKENLLSKLCTLSKVMRQFDVVHVHLFPSNYMVAVANIIARRPLVFTEHSTHNRRRDHKWLKPIERMVYRAFNQISCISEATASNLENWIGKKITQSRITIIGNGVNIQKYSKAEVADQSILFGRSGTPLLMISRLTASKDHPSVIRAISLINNPEIFVVFAGDGERRDELETLAKESGVEDRVVFLGNRNDIPTLIKTSAIGIQFSNWEGFGLTAIEIMAGGRPLIASNVEGLSDVVGNAGYIVEKGDSYALANAIQRLLSDRQLYNTLQQRGEQQARKYSIESTAQKYKKLYNFIIDKTLSRD